MSMDEYAPEFTCNTEKSADTDQEIVEAPTENELHNNVCLNHKPSLPMYWSVDDFIYTPIFSHIMTRNRFYLILCFLHFNDNEDPLHDINDENRNRLHKLHPLINLFQNRCRTV